MKTAIVYYSLTGNTDYAAQWIVSQIGADMVRLEPVKAYPDKGFRKFLWGGKSAVMQEEPPLLPYAFDADAYDQVVLGTPLWAGNFAPPLRTFLRREGEKIKGKRLSLFVCCSGGSDKTAVKKLRGMLGGVALDTVLVLVDPKDRPNAEHDLRLEQFCRALSGESVR